MIIKKLVYISPVFYSFLTISPPKKKQQAPIFDYSPTNLFHSIKISSQQTFIFNKLIINIILIDKFTY